MVVGVIVVVGLGGERKVVGWWQWRPREEVVWLGRWSGGGARGRWSDGGDCEKTTDGS